MDIYTYPQSSIVKEVSFVKADGGSLRAYLTAAEGADPKLLYAAMCHLADCGLQCIPALQNGKAALEVRGLRRKESLIELLEEKGSVVGEPKRIKEIEKPLGFIEQIKKRSLGASGLAYLVGDAAFATYGYKGGSTLNTIGGIFYGAGTASLLLGGRKDQSDIQIKDLSKKMTDYIRANGGEIPHECSLTAITDDSKKTTLQKTDALLRKYPSELMNLFFAAAGVCIAVAAHKHINTPVAPQDIEEVVSRKFNKMQALLPHTQIAPADVSMIRADIEKRMLRGHKREGWLDIGLGAMTSLSGLFAMMVKEKAHDPDAPKKEGWEGIWEKIQEKPLAVAGVGYMISTLCHATSTAIALNYATEERRKSVPFRAIFVASAVIAELLLAISSKGHGDGVVSDRSVDESVIALAADLIIQQPAKLQPALIKHVADFLGQPNVLALKDRDVNKELNERVAQMRENPWAKAQGEATKSKTMPIEKRTELDPEKMRAWQEKVAKAASIAPSPLIH